MHVFKTENKRLRDAIRQNNSFKNIRFEGGEYDYSITLVAKAKTKEEADTLLNNVKNFALNWGKMPDNQTWFHPDDGFNEDGTQKYKRVIEDSVKLMSTNQ